MSSDSGLPQNTNNYTEQNLLILSGTALGSILVLIAVASVCGHFCGRCWEQSTAVAAANLNVVNDGRCGLSASTIANIPTFNYKRLGDDEGGRGGWLQCAVCLCMVQEGEEVRQLPACNHLFHPECIDMWFYSHCTCPLCRSKVKAGGEVEVRDSGDDTSSSLAPPV